jgi:hypothetical protein
VDPTTRTRVTSTRVTGEVALAPTGNTYPAEPVVVRAQADLPLERLPEVVVTARRYTPPTRVAEGSGTSFWDLFFRRTPEAYESMNRAFASGYQTSGGKTSVQTYSPQYGYLSIPSFPTFKAPPKRKIALPAISAPRFAVPPIGSGSQRSAAKTKSTLALGVGAVALVGLLLWKRKKSQQRKAAM